MTIQPHDGRPVPPPPLPPANTQHAYPVQHGLAPYSTGAVQAPLVPPTAVRFGFDGGAGTWLGVQLGGALITLVTLGICFPWAVVMTYRWQAKHTYLNGRRLRFTGTAPALFGTWVKWLLLMIVTLGIYSFWVYPALTRWVVEHQELDPIS